LLMLLLLAERLTMAKEWTLPALKAISVHERANLYRNACRLRDTQSGAALKALIEAAGLPFSDDACLRMDDPITIRMYEIINSAEGRIAALEATSKGLPALAGVDHLLQASLGSDYGPHNMGTATAGALIADMMRGQGYKKGPQKQMPEGCVARSAVIWAS
jgi:hypothetical protein